MSELGFLYNQTAYVFAEGVEMMFFRESLFREHHPEFAGVARADLRRLVGENYGYLTGLQSKWQGLVMRVRGSFATTRMVHHAEHSVRGSVAAPLTDPLTAPVGATAPLRRPVDAKGTGLSPEGELELVTLHTFANLLLGLTTVAPLDQRALDGLKARAEKMRDEAQKGIEEQETEANADDGFRRSAGYLQSVYNARQEQQIAVNFLAGLEQLEAGREVPEAIIDAFLDALRRSDYKNGLMAAKRVAKEAFFEEAAQVVNEVLNEEWGTHYEVNANYFGLLLPVDILISGGKTNPVHEVAGVLGRVPTFRAHWQTDGKRRRFSLPAELFSSIFEGTEQFDLSGAVIDLETMQLRGPGIPPEFAYPFQRLDTWAEEAVGLFLAGDKNAVEEGLTRVRRAINVPVLRMWAKHNKPKSVADEAAAFRTAEAVARKIQASANPNPHDEDDLLRRIRAFYKKNMEDEARALVAIVALHSERVVDSLWLESVQKNAERYARDRRKALKNIRASGGSTEHGFLTSVDYGVPLAILGSQLSAAGPNLGMNRWRARRLPDFLKNHTDLALPALSTLAVETMRAVLASEGIDVAQIIFGTDPYRILGEAIGYIAYANSLPLEEIPEGAIDNVRSAFADSPELFRAGVHTAARILGVEYLRPELIAMFFPELLPPPRLSSCGASLAAAAFLRDQLTRMLRLGEDSPLTE